MIVVCSFECQSEHVCPHSEISGPSKVAEGWGYESTSLTGICTGIHLVGGGGGERGVRGVVGHVEI